MIVGLVFWSCKDRVGVVGIGIRYCWWVEGIVELVGGLLVEKFFDYFSCEFVFFWDVVIVGVCWLWLSLKWVGIVIEVFNFY